MNQLRSLHLRVYEQTMLVDIPWWITGLILAALTGWALPDLVSEYTISIPPAIAIAFIPAALAGSMALRESVQLFFPAQSVRPDNRLRILPFGSIPADYSRSPGPDAELRSALAGPAISLIIAMGFFLAFLAIPAGSWMRAVTLGLALINILLTLINILPAMPFSGGRILRSIFWFLHEDHTTGTRMAFVYGQLIASVFLGGGIFLLAWRGEMIVPGLWGVFFGWMVIRFSRNELMRSSLITRSSRVSAADAVTGLNPTIRAAAQLTEAIDIMLEQKDNGPGLVRDRNRFVGVLSLDIARRIPRSQWQSLTARDVMTSIEEFQDSPPDSPLLDVLQRQLATGGQTIIVRHGNGQIAGLIDESISPRVLLRRAEERSVAPPGPAASHRESRSS